MPDESGNVFIPNNYNVAPVITTNSGYGDGNENPGVVTGSGVRMRTLEIANGAELSVIENPDVFMYGGPNISGGGLNFSTFNITGELNPGESTFHLLNDETSSEASLTGILKFYNLNVADEAKVTIQSQAEIEILNSLTGTENSEFNAVDNQNTIIFSGVDEELQIQIPNPGNTTKGYYNLVLNDNLSSLPNILPAALNIQGDLSVNDDRIDFTTSELIFEGDEQEINSNIVLPELEFNKVVIENNTQLTVDINELIISNLELNSGKLLTSEVNKIILSGSLSFESSGNLGGLGTFEFTEPSIIGENLFENNRSLGNIILNNSNPETEYSIPDVFAIEGDFQVNSGYLLLNPSGLNESSLELGGNLTGIADAIGASEAHLILSNSSNQNIDGNVFENNMLKNITKTGLGTSVLTNPINLTGILRPDAGIFESDGYLTLKSTEDFTAVVGTLGQNAEISGNVLVERLIPPRRAFRLLSPTITSPESIWNNWQEAAIDYNDNPNPGFGTHITGTGEQSPTPFIDPNGFDWNPSGNPSLFIFDNLNRNWESVESTKNTSFQAGDAYRLLVRGSRDIDISSIASPPDQTILRTFGVLGQGTTVNTDLFNSIDRANFIGNPYQAPVDLALLYNSSINLSNFVIVWDPYLGGLNPTPGQPGGRGAFATVDVLTNNTTPSDSKATRFLQPGQAAFFYLLDNEEASNEPLEIIFLESHKAVDTEQTEIFSSPLPSLNLKLYTQSSFEANSTSSDGILIQFSDQFDNEITADDAPKMENIDENFARLHSGQLLSIESRKLPNEIETLPLYINQYRFDEYIIGISKQMFPDHINVFIKDKALNEITAIEGSNDIYHFDIDASIPGSAAFNRFELIFDATTMSIDEASAINDLVIYPNPVTNHQIFIKTAVFANTSAEVSLFDIVGKQIDRFTANFDSNGSTFIEDLNLKTGVYILKVSNSNENISQKIIVK